MKFALVGPGQLGQQVFKAAVGERLIVGEDLMAADTFGKEAELGVTTDMTQAAQCQVAAVCVPPAGCAAAFQQLCPNLAPGSIVLNFSTKWVIPQELREQFPQLQLLEAKLVGSAVSLSYGLYKVVVLGTQDSELTKLIQETLPGMNVVAGDYTLVKDINTLATKTALVAALSLEKELTAQGLAPEIIKAAVGGLMPGVLISYSNDTLGGFAREIVKQLKEEA